MGFGFFGEWRLERQLRRNAAALVEELHREPSETDVAWLASEVTGGDQDRARWELRYARRAIGLLVAQRAALDDRTAALVAHELVTALAADPNVAAGMSKVAERQFNERLRSFREALARRGGGEPTALRLARGLLLVAGQWGSATPERLARAAEITGRLNDEAAEALRRVFGTVDLREDIPPSAQVAPRR